MKATLSTYDVGLSMKKASEQCYIPYSLFREHYYGIQTSQVRGALGVLSIEEEGQLANWLIRMTETSHGLFPTLLIMKVSEITMTRPTPIRNGIPEGGWMQGWRRRHPKLNLHTTCALEIVYAKGSYEENINSFYNNLETLYTLHKYPP
jgi:hypothetical protein